MTITLNALQKQRRDTASNWTTNNTVLLAGELGYETDTKKFKIGDGTTAWQSLDYLPIPDTNRLLAGNLTVGGNFTVNGTTTTIDTTTLTVEDKNIEIGKVSSPSDTTADGGGISLLGTTTKTINWVNSTDSWTLSEHLDIATGKVFKINNTEVLSATTLGSSVVSSSLTSVGTITSGVWNGTAIDISKISGAMPLAGGTFTDDVTFTGASYSATWDKSDNALEFADNAKAVFGAGADLEIYHAAGQSYIQNSTGNFRIDADALRLRSKTNSEAFLSANVNGAVELYHGMGTSAAEKKFETTSTGATVTGNLTATETTSSDIFLGDSILHTGDTNTKIRFPSNDVFAVETGGDERVRINDTGVGIGTTSPTEKLDVEGSIRCNTGTDISMDSSASGQVRFRGNGYTGAIALDDDAMHIYSNASARDLVFGVHSSEKMRINSTGQVAIGTTTTNTNDRLTVLDPGNVFISIRSDAAADDTIQSLDFGVGTADRSSTNLTAVIKAKIHSQSGGTLKSDLLFSTNAGNSITERMRIDSSGVIFSAPTYSNTTSNSANMAIPNSDGQIYRSTSSRKYKTNIITLTDTLADKILSCNPVSYTSLCTSDDKTKVHYGFIAEEVHEIDTSLVFYDNEAETPEPEGVQYDRFIPALVNLIKRQKTQIETLEIKVAALEAA